MLVFEDADLAGVASSLASMGTTVLGSSDNGINKILRVSASGTRLASVAQHPDVEWIEPYVRPQAFNATAQWVHQTNASESRRIWDLGIHGEGR